MPEASKDKAAGFILRAGQRQPVCSQIPDEDGIPGEIRSGRDSMLSRFQLVFFHRA